MTQLRKALIRVDWYGRPPEDIEVQYNPGEYTIDKHAQYGEVAVPGLDSPLQQFVRGQTETLTMDLFFDTTDHGMGAGATSVTTETDKIYQLIKIEPRRHAPPILTFVWADQFPGSSIGGAPGAQASAATRGSEKWKVLPWPGSLLTPSTPPWASTSALAMLRPSPVPPALRVALMSSCWKRWKSLGTSSGAMPTPVSATSVVTHSPST